MNSTLSDYDNAIGIGVYRNFMLRSGTTLAKFRRLGLILSYT